MEHKNPVAPTTKLTINGVNYELLFDFDAVALAEDLTDRPLLTGLHSRDIYSPSINLVRSMLFAALLPNHPKITLPEAKALITRKNLSEVWSVVLNTWTAGMAEPDPEADEALEDPPPDQS